MCVTILIHVFVRTSPWNERKSLNYSKILTITDIRVYSSTTTKICIKMPINLIHFEQCQFSDAYRDKHGFYFTRIVNFYWIDTCVWFINSLLVYKRQVFISFQVTLCWCKCLNAKKVYKTKTSRRKSIRKTLPSTFSPWWFNAMCMYEHWHNHLFNNNNSCMSKG